MDEIKAKAIVVRAVPYHETDMIVTLMKVLPWEEKEGTVENF